MSFFTEFFFNHFYVLTLFSAIFIYILIVEYIILFNKESLLQKKMQRWFLLMPLPVGYPGHLMAMLDTIQVLVRIFSSACPPVESVLGNTSFFLKDRLGSGHLS